MFVERWKAAEGNELREANKFWVELFGEVLGVANPTHVLDFERKVKGRRIDVFHEDAGVLIENKSRGIDLDTPEPRGKDSKGNPRMETPFEQAKWYADNITPRSASPRWLITCNFDKIRIHDLNDEYPERDFETITLDELPEQFHRLTFMIKKENSRAEREKKLSVEAGEVVGKLYDAFAKSYLNLETCEAEQRSLNILITRIVFLLYAEDADLLHERNAFYNYLHEFSVPMMADALKLLFKMLNTPVNERDPYALPAALAFPYVNGGLFKEEIIIPQFNEDTRFLLLQEASLDFDWSDISPTIFGAVFESTLNPETRRSGGMHYTSVENIHKVTGPLFYDALKAELTGIEGLSVKKERQFKLRAFRQKLATIKVLDPACGSGNFLTETYLSLRKLENRVLEDLYGGEQAMLFEADPILVSTDQFYGIEINDFAVEVAKTALWIAELQMIEQTSEIMNMWIEPLPLKENENIMCGNALRMDWNDVLPAPSCSYIIGNPPFIGGKMSEEQANDAKTITGSGVLDYVTCWYFKFVEYAKDTDIQAAYVSTNSICQGEQTGILWGYVFKQGYEISFAHQTFRWDSEASDVAHVFVVIIGIAPKGLCERKRLFTYETVDSEPRCHEVENINGYLYPLPNFFVTSRRKPICDVPKSRQGSSPIDDGNLIIETEEERKKILSEQPDMSGYVRTYCGAIEFLKSVPRWCLWMVDYQNGMPLSPSVQKRLADCAAYRASRSRPQTNKAKNTPWLFAENRQPESNYLIIPRHSGERRQWIPFGFLEPSVIASDATQFIPDADLYLFGVLSSTIHNAWMRFVCGRLKSDYRYSVDIVYNNFIWPDPTTEQKKDIEQCAQRVLDTRDKYPDKSLAVLYKLDKMPDDLRDAHKALDAAVEEAYGVDFGNDEEKIVAHLFKLYAEMMAKQS